jgi:hypothetical protein
MRELSLLSVSLSASGAFHQRSLHPFFVVHRTFDDRRALALPDSSYLEMRVARAEIRLASDFVSTWR